MKDLLDIQVISCDNPNNNKDCLDSLPLAYAYVPYQRFETPMSMQQGLKCGTIFPRLNKPFGVYGNEFHTKEASEWKM